MAAAPNHAPNHAPAVRVADAFTVRAGPLALVAGYLALGLLWIVASDTLLAAVLQDPATLTAVQTVKGFVFVAGTAAFMYLILRRDFGVLHRAEGQLVEANQRLEHLAAFPRLSPGIILELGPGAAVSLSNDAARATAERLHLTSVEELLPPQAAETIALLEPGEAGVRAIDHRIAGRSLRWDFFPSDTPGRAFAYAIDVTAEEVSNARLVQSEKLDAIGKLAAGTAHDFNNLMTGIKAYTSVVLEELDPANPLRDDVLEIERVTNRASLMARRMLSLGRADASTVTRIDINDEVAEMSRLLGHLLPRKARLHITPAAEPLPVDADPGQLGRVLANLLVNAADAIADDGNVSISIARATGEATAWAQLSIQDDGAGMDAETLDRVFEPFFTTKAPGSGTGLGLSTCREIVEAAGGTITAASKPGEGSAFTITLPLAA